MAQETEVKFYVKQLAEIRQQVERLGGSVLEPRVQELNLRFDKPAGDLRRLGHVLRLRRDRLAWLTFKGAALTKDGAMSRREEEIVVSDFEGTKRVLEALGYVVVFIYEKYRTVYNLNGAKIMLDEMPYGSFVEIEGDSAALKPTADKLKLAWGTAIPLSYAALFEALSARRGFVFRDLSFKNFEGMQISPADLAVTAADS